MKRWWKISPFIRHEKGSTAVEFALLAPAIFLVMMGIIETTLLMFASQIMETAAAAAARTGKTGYVESGVDRATYIANVIKGRLDGLLDVNQLQITTKAYTQFDVVGKGEDLIIDKNHNGWYDEGDDQYADVNGNSQWDADLGMAGLGEAGQVVLYTITYPWPVMTPIMRQFFGADGTYTMKTTVVVRNEPYNLQLSQ